VNGNLKLGRAAARSGEWAQHFSNASCLFERLLVTILCNRKAALDRFLKINNAMMHRVLVCTSLDARRRLGQDAVDWSYNRQWPATSCLILVHWPYGMKTRRHPQNRKYLTHRNASRGEPSQRHGQHAQKIR